MIEGLTNFSQKFFFDDKYSFTTNLSGIYGVVELDC